MAADIKVLSLNVRGLHNRHKRKSLYSWIKNKGFDICFLQETFCIQNTVNKFNQFWSGDIYHSCSNSSHSRGVSIMISKKLSYKVHSYHTDDIGRKILINIEINDQMYTLVNIYAPNTISDRVTFFEQLNDFINCHSINKSNLIIGGDFNCVSEERDRVSGVVHISSKQLSKLLHEVDAIDIWRILHPDEIAFTYIDPSHQNKNSRIDMLLCSNILRPLCISCDITQAPVPDHKALSFCFKTNNNKRGKGYWKINNSIIHR